MTRSMADVEGDLRKLDQFEAKTQAEIAQLERDLSAEGKSIVNEDFSESGKITSFEVMTGIRSSLESKKIVLTGVSGKRSELRRELVELQRLNLIAPWKAIEAETWRRYDALSKSIMTLQGEINSFLPMVQNNSGLAPQISQDAGIEWGALQSFLAHINTDLAAWKSMTENIANRRRKL